MKQTSFSSLFVDPELRHAAENVLHKGETLDSFVEQSLRATIERRRMQRDFLARGLAARDEARRTGVYFTAEEVLKELDDKGGIV